MHLHMYNVKPLIDVMQPILPQKSTSVWVLGQLHPKQMLWDSLNGEYESLLKGPRGPLWASTLLCSSFTYCNL